jgi:hypothetical protein
VTPFRRCSRRRSAAQVGGEYLPEIQLADPVSHPVRARVSGKLLTTNPTLMRIAAG